VFKPGLAETKDAEAFEAVWSALKEQYNKQKKAGDAHPKATGLALDMKQEHLWKLMVPLSAVLYCTARSKRTGSPSKPFRCERKQAQMYRLSSVLSRPYRHIAAK
jgi:hypothetical protein